jgi:hypothetical protein
MYAPLHEPSAFADLAALSYNRKLVPVASRATRVSSILLMVAMLG